MIREAIEKIEEIKINRTYDIDGLKYSDNQLFLVEAPRYKPQTKSVKGINSIVSLIKAEVEKLEGPIFVEVEGDRKIKAYSTYNERFERQNTYEATSDVPDFRFGWKEYNEAMIAFRSQFKRTEDIDYILKLLSKITDENSISSEDNGLSQSVEVKKGIALKGKEVVKPIVRLTPYRTFMEIEQPESEFLLRLDEKGNIGLFEADGGMWRLEAKKRIGEALELELKGLIESEKVIVMY